MNSDFWQTAEATPPVMNHGLSTVWPPLQLVPASAHKSTEVFTLARSKHAAVIKVQMCYTTQCQSESTVIRRRQFLDRGEILNTLPTKQGRALALNTTPVWHCFSMSQRFCCLVNSICQTVTGRKPEQTAHVLQITFQDYDVTALQSQYFLDVQIWKYLHSFV